MNRYPTSRPAPAVPPDFVIWNSVPPQERVGWVRHCFGSELDKRASSTARGLGIREQMSNANVQRPIGTGDWLLMCFHEPARLNPNPSAALQPAKTMLVWPPGSPQFSLYGRLTARHSDPAARPASPSIEQMA